MLRMQSKKPMKGCKSRKARRGTGKAEHVNSQSHQKPHKPAKSRQKPKRHLLERNWECKGCEKPKPKSQEAKKPRSQKAKKPKSQEAKQPSSQKRKKKEEEQNLKKIPLQSICALRLACRTNIRNVRPCTSPPWLARLSSAPPPALFVSVASWQS